jgi:hypothetical protein
MERDIFKKIQYEMQKDLDFWTNNEDAIIYKNRFDVDSKAQEYVI